MTIATEHEWVELTTGICSEWVPFRIYPDLFGADPTRSIANAADCGGGLANGGVPVRHCRSIEMSLPTFA